MYGLSMDEQQYYIPGYVPKCFTKFFFYPTDINNNLSNIIQHSRSLPQLWFFSEHNYSILCTVNIPLLPEDDGCTEGEGIGGIGSQV